MVHTLIMEVKDYFDPRISLGNICTIIAAVVAVYSTITRQGDKIKIIEGWILTHKEDADKRDELGRELEKSSIRLVEAVEYLSLRIKDIELINADRSMGRRDRKGDK